MSLNGSIKFAKYAYSPNKLGYCGPAGSGTIFDYCVANQSDEGLIKLLSKFEGALPYLSIIAKSNHIKDAFDEKVVEAYWIGNSLLESVTDLDFYNSLSDRFKAKIDKNKMKWILTKPIVGAKPNHAFHVLDIYTKTGSLRSGVKTSVISTINKCMILYGKVISEKKSDNDSITIEYNPLVIKNNKIIFGDKIKKEVFSPFVKTKIGDIVSFHWDNVCEVLNVYKLNNLKNWTLYHIDIANRTV